MLRELNPSFSIVDKSSHYLHICYKHSGYLLRYRWGIVVWVSKSMVCGIELTYQHLLSQLMRSLPPSPPPPKEHTSRRTKRILPYNQGFKADIQIIKRSYHSLYKPNSPHLFINPKKPTKQGHKKRTYISIKERPDAAHISTCLPTYVPSAQKKGGRIRYI